MYLPFQNGSHLYVTQLVQEEPSSLRRTIEHFLARMEQRKRAWQSRGREAGPEEEEEESQASVAKKPKLTQSEGCVYNHNYVHMMNIVIPASALV